jgi:hypothetical protein
MARRDASFFNTLAAHIKASRHALKQRDDHGAPMSTSNDSDRPIGLPTSEMNESDTRALREHLTRLRALKQMVDGAMVEQTSSMRSTLCMMRYQSDPLSSSGGFKDMTTLAVTQATQQKASQLPCQTCNDCAKSPPDACLLHCQQANVSWDDLLKDRRLQNFLSRKNTLSRGHRKLESSI